MQGEVLFHVRELTQTDPQKAPNANHQPNHNILHYHREIKTGKRLGNGRWKKKKEGGQNFKTVFVLKNAPLEKLSS